MSWQHFVTLTGDQLNDELEKSYNELDLYEGRLSADASFSLDYALDKIKDIEIEQALRILMRHKVKLDDVFSWTKDGRAPETKAHFTPFVEHHVNLKKELLWILPTLCSGAELLKEDTCGRDELEEVQQVIDRANEVGEKYKLHTSQHETVQGL